MLTWLMTTAAWPRLRSSLGSSSRPIRNRKKITPTWLSTPRYGDRVGVEARCRGAGPAGRCASTRRREPREQARPEHDAGDHLADDLRLVQPREQPPHQAATARGSARSARGGSGAGYRAWRSRPARKRWRRRSCRESRRRSAGASAGVGLARRAGGSAAARRPHARARCRRAASGRSAPAAAPARGSRSPAGIVAVQPQLPLRPRSVIVSVPAVRLPVQPSSASAHRAACSPKLHVEEPPGLLDPHRPCSPLLRAAGRCPTRRSTRPRGRPARWTPSPSVQDDPQPADREPRT